MGLSAEEILDRLQEGGFAVAPRAYHERRHHMRRAMIDFSIDFATGLVNHWGRKDWLSLDQALLYFAANTLEAASSPTSAPDITERAPNITEPAGNITEPAGIITSQDGSITAPQMPLNAAHWAWLGRCRRAGFTIVDGPSDVANVGAKRDGVRYVLLPYTRSILSRGFVHHQLAEFEAPREIVTTGRSLQAALFGDDDA